MIDPAVAAVRGLVVAVQSDRTRRAVREASADAFEGAIRVARATRVPTRKGVLDFLSYQLVVNLVAWTAGLTASGLVTHFFEVKGYRNLWGLVSSGGRTLLSASDYRLVMTITSFCVGLTMMILVRHFILRWIDEIRALRRERRGGQVGVADEHAKSLGSCIPDLADLDGDPGP